MTIEIIVGSSNLSRLKKAYQLRNQVFVREMNFSDLSCKDGMEIDQFDGQDAIHILIRDQYDDVAAYSRLLPTTSIHLLGEIYPQLVSHGKLPISPYIYEWTRCCVSLRYREGCGFSEYYGDLLYGVLTTCLQMEIHSLSLVSSPSVITTLSELGWEVSPLGLPKKINGRTEVALLAKIMPSTIHKTTQVLKVNYNNNSRNITQKQINNKDHLRY